MLRVALWLDLYKRVELPGGTVLVFVLLGDEKLLPSPEGDCSVLLADELPVGTVTDKEAGRGISDLCSAVNTLNWLWKYFQHVWWVMLSKSLNRVGACTAETSIIQTVNAQFNDALCDAGTLLHRFSLWNAGSMPPVGPSSDGNPHD